MLLLNAIRYKSFFSIYIYIYMIDDSEMIEDKKSLKKCMN